MLPPKLRPGRRVRVLISYWYFQNTDMEEFVGKFGCAPEIFADSGAFTAFVQGGRVDVNAYAEWLLKWRHLLETYANLDVLGDADAGLRNLSRLEAQGLRPLPIYHLGEPWSVLSDLVAQYDYVGVGGMVGTGAPRSDSPAMMSALTRCFRIADGRCSFHGLGLTAWTPLSTLPWYSADSTSWLAGVRYGISEIFDYRVGKFKRIPHLDRSRVYTEMKSLIESYGVDWKEVGKKPDKLHRQQFQGLAANSYAVAERWIRLRHGEVPGPSGKKGLRIYLANSDKVGLWHADSERVKVCATRGGAARV